MTPVWVENDGGRAAAGYKGRVGDCTVRAIAIATEQDYQVVYDALFALNREAKAPRGKNKKASPRDGGTAKKTIDAYLASLGWTWVPTMHIGSGTTVHLKADELPSGRIVTRLSRHMAAVIDGVVHDTYDCTRGGTRAVYGYYVAPGADTALPGFSFTDPGIPADVDSSEVTEAKRRDGVWYRIRVELTSDGVPVYYIQSTELSPDGEWDFWRAEWSFAEAVGVLNESFRAV